MDKIKYIKLENEDGTYSNSIPLSVDSDHVDVNGVLLTNELNNKATKAEVQSLASGSPLVASSINDMTNVSKVYVNTTDGNWYYYNGSNWIVGGVYQSTAISDNEIKVNNLDNNLDGLLDIDELTNASSFNWEQGIIDGTTGNPGTDTTHAYWNITIRTSDFVDMNKKIFHWKKLTDFGVVVWFYDKFNKYLGRINSTDDYNINEYAGNIYNLYPDASKFKVTVKRRTTLGSTYTPSDYLPEHLQLYRFKDFIQDKEIIPNYLDDTLSTFENIYKFTTQDFNWEQGEIDDTTGNNKNNGSYYYTTTIRSKNYITLTHKKMNLSKLKDYSLKIYLYDNRNNFINVVTTLDNYDVPTLLMNINKNYPMVCKFKLAVRRKKALGTTYSPSDFSDNQVVVYVGDKFNENNYINSNDDNLLTIDSMNFGTDSYASGQTLVKDKFVSFGISDDEHLEYKELHIFKINKTTKGAELIKIMTHNFGHVNSVDYCEHTDCLIFGNGSGYYNRNGQFYIYKNFSQVINDDNVTQLSINDSNVLAYDCSDTPFYTEDKWNVIWFDSDRNLYDLALLVTNDTRKFRVLQLGKGNNEFQYGSLSSVLNTEFNGTFRVIDEYTFNTGESQQVSQWVLQDMDYQSGKLYCGINHDYPYYWIFTFNRKEHTLSCEEIPIYTYNEAGNNLNKHVGGICCNNEYIILNTGFIIIKPRV